MMIDDPMPPFVDVLMNDSGQSAGSIRAIDDGILEYLEERERTKPMVKTKKQSTKAIACARYAGNAPSAMRIVRTRWIYKRWKGDVEWFH